MCWIKYIFEIILMVVLIKCLCTRKYWKENNNFKKKINQEAPRLALVQHLLWWLLTFWDCLFLILFVLKRSSAVKAFGQTGLTDMYCGSSNLIPIGETLLCIIFVTFFSAKNLFGRTFILIFIFSTFIIPQLITGLLHSYAIILQLSIYFINYI